MEIDLSLKNSALYQGCEIKKVVGRLKLTTPMTDAVEIVAKNIANIMRNHGGGLRVTLTGSVANTPIYFIVFREAEKCFDEVWYQDVTGKKVLMTQHGFVDNNDGTVTDRRTRLTWARMKRGREWNPISWEEANKKMPGFRLPTIGELRTIYRKELFPNIPKELRLWSCSEILGMSSLIMGMSLYRGVESYAKDEKRHALLVKED
jgi:hypothetical protein